VLAEKHWPNDTAKRERDLSALIAPSALCGADNLPRFFRLNCRTAAFNGARPDRKIRPTALGRLGLSEFPNGRRPSQCSGLSIRRLEPATRQHERANNWATIDAIRHGLGSPIFSSAKWVPVTDVDSRGIHTPPPQVN
jgi:hypothetical protein